MRNRLVQLTGTAIVIIPLWLSAPGSLFAQSSCGPLPPPTGAVVDVHPTEAAALPSIVDAAASGTTILLHDGSYPLTSSLYFHTPGVVLRSASGNRDAVILDAAYGEGAGEIIAIAASDVTIADLSIHRAYYHAVHIWDDGSIVSGILLHNLHVVDPAEQAIKVNPANGGFVDDSTIACCQIELTDTGRAEVRNDCYTGGIDVHQAWGWEVRNNRIEGFWCPSGLSEHGIHFWRGSRDTLVDSNVVVNCARGIGFGLGESGTAREYADDPYPEVGFMGHIDGVIRNNFVAASDARIFSSEYGFDTGIALEQAHGTAVLHNSVASTAAPASSSIEYRFLNTSAWVANNLCTHALLNREDPAPIAIEEGNLGGVAQSWFADVAAGDLHLSEAAGAAIDAGEELSGWCELDHDGQRRDGAPDVGADEVVDEIFADGFESGGAGAWSAASP